MRATVLVPGLTRAAPCVRETGMDVELADVPVCSLVPEPLRGAASVDDFMARLPEFDGDIAEQLAAAEAAGECLRFVGAPPSWGVWVWGSGGGCGTLWLAVTSGVLAPLYSSAVVTPQS